MIERVGSSFWRVWVFLRWLKGRNEKQCRERREKGKTNKTDVRERTGIDRLGAGPDKWETTDRAILDAAVDALRPKAALAELSSKTEADSDFE